MHNEVILRLHPESGRQEHKALQSQMVQRHLDLLTFPILSGRNACGMPEHCNQQDTL